MGIVVKKIKPMFTAIVTTADMYKEPVYLPSGLIDATKTKQGLKEYQRVVAVGPHVRDINVGDLVCINPSAYAVRKYDKNSLKADMADVYNSVTTYNFKFIEMADGKYLSLTDRDIDFVVEEYDEVPDKPIDMEGRSLATF